MKIKLYVFFISFTKTQHLMLINNKT